MNTIRILAPALALFWPALLCAQPKETMTPNVPPPTATPCIFRTIVQGDFSGYGMNQPGFKGAECLILTPAAWHDFWLKHTSHYNVTPPVPPVDFNQFAVVAVVLGPQNNGGGSYIRVNAVQRTMNCTQVTVEETEMPGPLPVISNPFHIVRISRACLMPLACICFNHIHPPPVGALAGHVVTPSTSTNTPTPVAGALVRLFLNASAAPREQITDNTGAYMFADVPVGTHHVVVTKAGFQPADADVQIQVGQVTTQNFVLLPAPPPPAPGAVVGRVFAASNAGSVPMPLAGATVRLIGPVSNQVLQTTTTNNTGNYQFPTVPPGNYQLRAEAQGYQPAQAGIMVQSGQTTQQNFLLHP